MLGMSNYKYFSKETKDRGLLYYLDIGIVSDEEYDVLKPIIESLGGHWREREKCFIFGIDVKDEVANVFSNNFKVSQEWLDEWKEQHRSQFFPTPHHIAERVVELAEIKDGQNILEPSAGQGALLDCIHAKDCHIIAIEPEANNVKYLADKGYNYVKTTFEDIYSELMSNEGRAHLPTEPLFDRVIMNPPFSSQNDIKHYLMAYELLRKNGIIVGILSENALYYDTVVTKDFNVFLKEHNAYIEVVPFHSFKESGTTIDTVIIKIYKKEV